MISKTQEDIVRIMDSTKNLLLYKNEKYGDSALNPLGIFTKGEAIVNLGARMEDKLMRLKEVGMTAESIDTLYDLQGYLTLMIIAIERDEQIDSVSAIHQGDTNTKEIIDGQSKSNNVRIGIQDRQAVPHKSIKGSTTHTGGVFFRGSKSSKRG